MHFGKAHSSNRNDGHVERIKEIPAHQNHISDSAEHHNQK